MFKTAATTRNLGSYASAAAARAAKPVPHLLSMRDLTTPQIVSLVNSSLKLKHYAKNAGVTSAPSQPLKGQTLAVMFSKRSTRTRVSAESAMAYLGGHAMFLGSQDIQLGVNESLLDTAKVISSMVSGIMARVYKHEEVAELAKHSRVPVINALSDLYHPTQTLADLMTMHEATHADLVAQGKMGVDNHTDVYQVGIDQTLPGKKVAWIGDSNNILYDMLNAMPRLGVSVSIATPRGYQVPLELLEAAHKDASESKHGTSTTVEVSHDPVQALEGADFIVTDTWVSMGQESEKAARLRDFAGFQVSNELIKKSNPSANWKFMHCLPRKQEEVTDEVFYNQRRSIVFEEAENRKWTIMAALQAMLVDGHF
ncbi:ornithine carbamoyltransferase [Ramicandelaber brevisporus]|nr:ornithine carbamoyltransferase [Ramicandelaber brevisporus]